MNKDSSYQTSCELDTVKDCSTTTIRRNGTGPEGGYHSSEKQN